MLNIILYGIAHWSTSTVFGQGKDYLIQFLDSSK